MQQCVPSHISDGEAEKNECSFHMAKESIFIKSVLRRCVINPRRPCSTFWLFSVICVQLIADKKSTVHSWSV